MQRLEVSCAVRLIYTSSGVKGLIVVSFNIHVSQALTSGPITEKYNLLIIDF